MGRHHMRLKKKSDYNFGRFVILNHIFINVEWLKDLSLYISLLKYKEVC